MIKIFTHCFRFVIIGTQAAFWHQHSLGLLHDATTLPSLLGNQKRQHQRRTILYKTTALADEIALFFLTATKGKLYESVEEPTPLNIGSQETPISFGLSEGYSPQDIAYFDIARELGNIWILKAFEKLDQTIRSEIEETFEAFKRDVVKELKHARKS